MKIQSVLASLLLLAGGLAFAAPPKPKGRVTVVEHWPELPEKTGWLSQVLVGGDRDQVQVSLLTLAPGAEVAPTRAVSGQLLVYVIDGGVSVVTLKEKPLRRGDAVQLFAGGSAGLRNSGTSMVQALVIAAPPGRLALEAVAPSTKAREPGGSGKAPVLFRVEGVKPLSIAEGKAEILMLAEAAGAGAYLGTFRALGGLEIPAHVHERSTEVLFVLDGEGELTLHGETVALGPGSVVFLPPNVEHAFRHAGDGPLEAVQIYAPPGPEQRFKGAPPPAKPPGGSVTGAP